MSNEQRDTFDVYTSNTHAQVHAGTGASTTTPSTFPPQLMGAQSLIGNDVYNRQDDNLGSIQDIMLDTRLGQVAYAVLTFGGFMGVGNKLFAVPWAALTRDTQHERFVLNIDKSELENAPGFDKDNWPDMADPIWAQSVHQYYGTEVMPQILNA